MFDKLRKRWSRRNADDFVDGDDDEGFNIQDVDLADVDVPKLEKLAELFAEVDAIKDDDERLTAAKKLVAKVGD
jgi:hypothetical protein